MAESIKLSKITLLTPNVIAPANKVTRELVPPELALVACLNFREEQALNSVKVVANSPGSEQDNRKPIYNGYWVVSRVIEPGTSITLPWKEKRTWLTHPCWAKMLSCDSIPFTLEDLITYLRS